MAKFIQLTDDQGRAVAIPYNSIYRIKYMSNTNETWVVTEKGGIRVNESYDDVRRMLREVSK